MIRYTNECVGPCPQGCIGSCPYRHVPHYICDTCDNEYDPDELYDDDGDFICMDCLMERHPKIRV